MLQKACRVERQVGHGHPLAHNTLKINGGLVRRVLDRSRAEVPQHSHDWPVLSLFVMGGYRNRTESGERHVDSPSAVLYRARAAHQNTAGLAGFEQIEVEFDPDWLGVARLPDEPVLHWVGGRAAADVRQLVRLCRSQPSEDELRAVLQAFLAVRLEERPVEPPRWLKTARHILRCNPGSSVTALAEVVGLHPSWFGQAFVRLTGESIRECALRYQVECAAQRLRETEDRLADIALATGFCDQSHMNRGIRRLMDRTPGQVRADRQFRDT